MSCLRGIVGQLYNPYHVSLIGTARIYAVVVGDVERIWPSCHPPLQNLALFARPNCCAELQSPSSSAACSVSVASCEVLYAWCQASYHVSKPLHHPYGTKQNSHQAKTNGVVGLCSKMADLNETSPKIVTRLCTVDWFGYIRKARMR